MTNNVKRFFSLFLAVSLVFGLVVPAAAAENDDHEHEQTSVAAPAAEKAEETIPVEEASENVSFEVSLENVKLNVKDMDLNVSLNVPLLMSDEEVEIDREDPAIANFEATLQTIKVWDAATQESVALTPEQTEQVLGLYNQYLTQMEENADVLGMQTPFFLDFNDDKDDLGALGEMLALAGKSVDQVRNGEVSYDELVGTIINFYYGDKLGLEFYRSAIEAARDKAVQAVKDANPETFVQELLVLNDWLGHNNTFDMPYIMNDGKEKPIMVAENPQKPEHIDDVVAALNEGYRPILEDTFKQQIRDGLKAEMKVKVYTEAIRNVIYQGALEQARQKATEQIRDTQEWKDAYDAAYKQLTEGDHVHSATVTVVWTPKAGEKTEEGVQAYEVTVTAKCADCEEVLTVSEGVTVTASTTATCTVAGKTTYTVGGVTVKDSEDQEVSIANPEALTKEVENDPALGHDFGEDGKCKREGCEETAHTHKAVVTLEWSKPDNRKYEASVKSVECEDTTCEEELDAVVDSTSEDNTKVATCTEDGEVTYTAKVTVKDSKGNVVEDVEITNPERKDTIAALGHRFGADGKCTNPGCDVVQETHTHRVKVTVEWNDANEPSATAICENANCPGVKASVTANEPDVLKAATCTEEGQTKYTATVTVTDSNGAVPGTSIFEVEGTEHIATTEKKPHDYNTAGICANCGAVSESHTHNVTVTVNWDEAGTGYTATVGATSCACNAATFTVAEPTVTPTERVPSTCTEAGHVTYTATIGEVTASDGKAVTVSSVVNETYTVNLPLADHSFGTGATCDNCDAPNPGYTPRPAEAASSASDIPEFFTFTQKAATVAAEGEEEGELTEEEIQAKATEMADEALGVSEQVEAIVTGGTEDVDTEVEQQAKQAADDYIAANEEAIKEDPEKFVNESEDLAPAAPMIHGAWDDFWADAEANGIEVDPENAPGYKMSIDEIVAQQMDQPLDALGGATPNEFIDATIQDMANGIITYWKGCHIGALGFGVSVCLGYTKAMNYLVQYMHPEVYGNYASSNMSNAKEWKPRNQLYRTKDDGSLDINSGYIVDCVRINFDAAVTMFGRKEPNFTGVHFWNAVKIDDGWFYMDPCYVDVYTEVMNRDRVETDGHMNHMYFLFSDASAREMYDGYMTELRSLYEEVSKDTVFEDAWVSRIKSNTYFQDGYAYYVYDSTDMITIMQDANNNPQEFEDEYAFYKLVRHDLTAKDKDDGDTDYETLVFFNYKNDPEDDDEKPVAKVLDPESGELVDNELLTELYARHEVYTAIYPSVNINASLYNNKMYFNLANCILSYDIATGEVKLVKEYNTVKASRDNTNPFGGMAFSISSDGSHTVENAPVAASTIKADGKMYVSIATRYGFISGKEDLTDPSSAGYGYEYQESNFNPNYNTYMDQKMGDFDGQISGMNREENDNDEFMWSANFVETLSMSHLDGSSHSYQEVSIPATCGRDAYTENRCTTCGASEDGSRVYEEGTALEHHFVYFPETYYTREDSKDENSPFNTGECCVCTICGFCVNKPDDDDDDAEEARKAYEEVKATAGHTYEATDATWASDNSTVTFKTLVCDSVCPDIQDALDCLLDDNTITIELAKKTTLNTTVQMSGLCPDGLTYIYEASGETTVDGKTVPYTIRKIVNVEPADHKYSNGVCTVCGDCGVKRVSGDTRIETALEVAYALKDALEVEKFDTIILANGENKRFPDALTGSYLATIKGAPILMYRDSGMTENNLQFIEENLNEGGTIYLLGSEVVIPEEVEETLKDYTENVIRLAGPTRFETNLAILDEAGMDGVGEILIARGYNFADSLSGSATGLPILLVNDETDKLTDSQIEFLTQYQHLDFTILGSTSAVSQALEDQIAEVIGKTPERVFGDWREDTSVEIAEKYFNTADFAVLAYSRGSADGLCGGPLAYAMKAPLLLTDAGKEAATNKYIAARKISEGYVLGGSNVVADETVRGAFGLPESAEIKAR